MLTQDKIDAILANADFNECLKDAVPHKLKIINDIMPQVKEVQADYLDLMKESNYKNVDAILNKLKLDKRDETAKEDFRVWKKEVMGFYKDTVSVLHPNENQVPSIGKIYSAGSFLVYIGRDDLITGNENYNKDIPLNFKRLEDINPFFDDDNVRARMKQIFIDADDLKGQMIEETNAIKHDLYEQLPSSIRYDKDVNRTGLKTTHFCALVKHQATGMLKSKDQYTKYINAQIDNSNDNIDRESIVLGKIKQM